MVECLVSLARNYNRSIIFTIHQPRSNIFALFDRLILLAKGRLVYSGSVREGLIQHFAGLGYECPIGFNLADYLVDLTMHAAISIQRSSQNEGKTVREEQEDKLYSPHGNSEALKAFSIRSVQPSAPVYLIGEPNPVVITDNNCIKPFLSRELFYIINGYSESKISKALKLEIATELRDAYPSISETALGQLRSQAQERPSLRLGNVSTRNPSDLFVGLTGYIENLFNPTTVRSGANHLDQFLVISSRTFKNLYRSPALLKTHYAISVAAAVICGFLFWGVDDTLAGFQNRLGVFFFICALFGFGCLSSMQAFASERLLFKKERANRYYSPAAYFTSKVLFN